MNNPLPGNILMTRAFFSEQVFTNRKYKVKLVATDKGNRWSKNGFPGEFDSYPELLEAYNGSLNDG